MAQEIQTQVGKLKADAPNWIKSVAARANPKGAADFGAISDLAPKVPEQGKGYSGPGLIEGLQIQPNLEKVADAFLVNATKVPEHQAESLVGVRARTSREMQEEHRQNEEKRAALIEQFKEAFNDRFKNEFNDREGTPDLSETEMNFGIAMLGVRCNGEGADDKTGGKLSKARVKAIVELSKIEAKLIGKHDKAPLTDRVYQALLRRGSEQTAERYRPGLTTDRALKIQDTIVHVFGLKNARSFFEGAKISPKDAFEKFLEKSPPQP